MYTVVLLLLFHGMDAPGVYEPKHEQPFVGHAACDEWAAQEARRIERVIRTLKADNRPEQWELRCVPLGRQFPA